MDANTRGTMTHHMHIRVLAPIRISSVSQLNGDNAEFAALISNAIFRFEMHFELISWKKQWRVLRWILFSLRVWFVIWGLKFFIFYKTRAR